MLSNRRAKDAAMAAMMKMNKVERTSASCPVCHGLVSLNRLYGHVTASCGRTRGERHEAKDSEE